jgi:RNA polymerase sigma-B factor
VLKDPGIAREETGHHPPIGTDHTDAAEVSAAERTRETEALFRRALNGDEAARAALIERFLPLARQLARRYQRANEPLDDLVQVASIGLVKAVDRFDLGRGVAFSSYAVPTILGELKRYFRDSGWAVHVPRGVQERAMQVDRAVKDLSGKLGRSPSVDEVAEAIEVSAEDVLGAMEAGLAYEAISLDASRASDDNEGDTFADSIGVEDDRFDVIEYEATIAPTLKALPKRDQLVLHLRFSEDMTQSQIAECIGVSQMQVSRLIRRALARLRTVAEATERKTR